MVLPNLMRDSPGFADAPLHTACTVFVTTEGLLPAAALQTFKLLATQRAVPLSDQDTLAAICCWSLLGPLKKGLYAWRAACMGTTLAAVASRSLQPALIEVLQHLLHLCLRLLVPLS